MIDNIERRARLACFVLELFPNIMRFSVLHYMLKKGLSNKYCNNIRYPSVFTTTELLLIQELPNVNNFTIQLCYKLITFEELLPTPSKGWGKFPDSNALKVEDDIERIRHGINEILTVNDEHFTECYLVKFLYKLEQIIQRLQIALGTTRVDSIYKSVLRKNIDTAVVLEELRNVDIIDSDATIIKLQDRERYSKIGAVITEFFPKILRINIPTWYSPLIVHSMCTQPGRYWNKSQTLQINTLKSSLNFESLDASMLYQLFRTFSLVPGPTQGWGKKPTESDKCTADDIERIHHLRNECAHRCDTCIDQATFDNYFVQFHKITHRIASDYEHELSALSRDSLDPKRQKELEEALQKLEDIKEQFRRKPMRFFWGNDMALLIKDIRQRIHREKDILGQEKFLIEIELINIDDAETKAKILNEARSQINEIDLNIEFLGAFTGSLVLYAYINRETLATDDILQIELSSFMTRILKKGKLGMISTQWIDAVIFPSEGNKELELNSSIAKSLRLQFNVNMNAFETDVSLESEMGACMQRAIKNLNGKGFNDDVTAIVHCVQSEDTEDTRAIETSPLIQVDKIVEMDEESTVVKEIRFRIPIPVTNTLRDLCITDSEDNGSNEARVKNMASNTNPYKTTVFHHTSEEAVDAIYKSGHIRQSDIENGDAVFGQGVYAYKMGPECSRTDIAKNNYDGNTSFVQDQIGQGKVNAAIEIQYNRDEVIKVDADGRDVYKIQNDIPVSKIMQVHYRDKDDA